MVNVVVNDSFVVIAPTKHEPKAMHRDAGLHLITAAKIGLPVTPHKVSANT